MSFRFKVMTDSELNNLLPEGVYSFEVNKSTRKVSKSGNDMAELGLVVWDASGKSHYLRDWLVFSDASLSIRKIKHFCDAVGLQESYKKGELPEDLERLSGKVKIGIEDEQPKADGGFWPKKNVVMDYVKLSVAANAANTATVMAEKIKADADLFNDDLPF